LTLDEPASQLDPVAADELLATLARLNTEWGTTVLLADHRIERSLKLASRVLVLERGAIVCDEPPRKFLAWAAASGRHNLLTPSARLCSLAGIAPLPTGVERARELIGDAVPSGWLAEDGSRAKEVAPPTSAPARGSPVLALRSVGFAHARAERPAIDRVDLELRAGERVALMGANGSGKSTLLRLARGLLKPSAGSVAATGEVALLLQNPNDYLIHERVGEEAPPHALECFGLAGYTDRDPRDLSGGERQRLALAIVMQDRPAVLLLDEPTRGMDGERKRDLIELLVSLAGAGTAVVLATHDSESAAAFADRIVLLGDGQVLADGAARELLGAGAQYATETARLLPGSGALTPDQGAAWLATRSTTGESLAAGAAR
ncbi:MAG: ATP-binding cassette domain-containing protein, partial [Thermoleophilia bacterium]|nr:ATP-binding cassette domain-containing protein [Thermoleophilia bacterium]